MKKYWWKILCVIFVLYTIIAGFLVPVPRLVILHETIRNLVFHVPMWMVMFLFFTVSCIYSIIYLRNNKIKNDLIANAGSSVGLLFGVIGICTGMMWAKYTWGSFWSNDPKQLCTAVALLIYFAYFVLRNSFTDIDKRARVAAVYNIFAFALLIPLTIVIPRLTDSLHPGNGGNPGFNVYDTNGSLKTILYPAFIGWSLLGAWIFELQVRLKKIEIKSLLND
jgi:heme exporter protein C